jgi:hypothetical protein
LRVQYQQPSILIALPPSGANKTFSSFEANKGLSNAAIPVFLRAILTAQHPLHSYL